MKSHDIAATQRRLSNIAHWIEGALLGLLAILALLEALGVISGVARYVRPRVLLAAGTSLPWFVLGHDHVELGHARKILKDPQQRQHLAMSMLLFGAGIAELVATAGWLGAAAYEWPLVLAAIGVMFTVHTQHGDHTAMSAAVRFHRVLGGIMVVTSVASVIELAAGAPAVTSAAMLLAVAGLLVAYREPSGAYQVGQTHGAHGGGCCA